MNIMKSSSLLFKHAGRCRINQATRHIASASKLLDTDVNSKTGIATVTLKNPPVNSLALELVNELTSTLLALEKEKPKGMIITSSAPGVFSAGFDLKEFYKPNQDKLKTYWTSLQDMWLNLYSAAYPTVALITGHSPGGGCMVATSCDYRVMVKGNYTIGLNETQLGLAVPFWMIDNFLNVVPRRIGEMALLTGKLFPVDEALKVGLIDEVAASNEEAMEKSLEYIKSLSKFSMTAMAQTKLAVRYHSITRLQDNREQDLRVVINFITSPEVQKRLELYIEALKKKSSKS